MSARSSDIELAEMQELIDDAKKQVIEWYNPQTKRHFIKTQIWSASYEWPEQRHPGELTELYVLDGGEAKGTIIADYYNGVVTCYDKYHTKVMTRRTMYADRRLGDTE